MPRPSVQLYDPEALAASMHSVLARAVTERGAAALAIPGGRSPGEALSALARRLSPFERERLHLLWVDERALPLGHGDRNDGATLAAWKAGGPLPAHAYPMPAEADDLEDAARSYERTLGEVLAGEPLDVCLLGMGEDGHVASLFPNHAGLDETRRVFAVYDSPKPPQRRLTLSLGEISTARMIVVLALGAEKAAIAAQAWRGPDRGLPVSLLPPERTHWYLDAAARSAAGDGWRGER